MGAKDFQELRVYQSALDGALRIFAASKNWPPEERYHLVAQIRDSSRSVCGNIAEAWRKRRYPAAFVSKLSDADGEAAETMVWLKFAVCHGYIDSKRHAELQDRYDHICAQLAIMMRPGGQWQLGGQG